MRHVVVMDSSRRSSGDGNRRNQLTFRSSLNVERLFSYAAASVDPGPDGDKATMKALRPCPMFITSPLAFLFSYCRHSLSPPEPSPRSQISETSYGRLKPDGLDSKTRGNVGGIIHVT